MATSSNYGSETNHESVRQSLEQRLPEFRSWSSKMQVVDVENSVRALGSKRELDSSVLLHPYFPVPALGNNDPYTECFDGNEQTYAVVKQKLRQVYPEWRHLKGDRPVEIVRRCLENLELERHGPRPDMNKTLDMTVFSGFEKDFLQVKKVLQEKSAHFSTLGAKGRRGYARRCLRELQRRRNDGDEALEENSTIPGRYIESSSAESLQSGSEDSPRKEMREMVTARLEAPLEEARTLMQKSVAGEIEKAERKHIQKITELEAENAKVRAENGEIKTENSALRTKTKKLVAELARITMGPETLKAMRSDATPATYKPLKLAPDAEGDQSLDGKNKSSGSNSRKRAASEVPEPAETPSCHKKKKKKKKNHKSSKKRAAKGVD